MKENRVRVGQESRTEFYSSLIRSYKDLGPFQALQAFDDLRSVGDDDGDQRVRVDPPMGLVDEGRQVDISHSFGEAGVVVDWQVVDDKAGVSIHEGRGCFELPGLALDERAACVVQLGLTGGATPYQGRDVIVNVIERLGDPIALKRPTDRKRARAFPAIEVTPNSVRESSFLPQLGIEPRGELTSQNLVQDHDVFVERIISRQAEMAHANNGLSRARPVKQDDPRM